MTSVLLARLADVLEYPRDDFRERCTALKTLLEEERPEAAQHALERVRHHHARDI